LTRQNRFSWRQYLAAGEMESKLAAIRQCTHTGRPLGSTEFVQALDPGFPCPLFPSPLGSISARLAMARSYCHPGQPSPHPVRSVPLGEASHLHGYAGNVRRNRYGLRRTIRIARSSPCWGAYWRKIRIEEQYLHEALREEYAEYCRNTSKDAASVVTHRPVDLIGSPGYWV
jgi:hypothetical protein